MRKLIAVAALALIIPATASAQDGRGQGRGRGMPMLNSVEWLLKSKEEFKATPEQVTKIEAISKKFDGETAKQREEMQKVREEMMGGGADRQTVMQKMRPIRDELQKKDEAAVKEVLSLLSEDQQKTVLQLLETRREEMKNRRGNQPPRQ
jgi:Spy/CpxP family protein refolding chaperone